MTGFTNESIGRYIESTALIFFYGKVDKYSNYISILFRFTLLTYWKFDLKLFSMVTKKNQYQIA